MLQINHQYDVFFKIGYYACPGYFVDAERGILLSYHSYYFRKIYHYTPLPENTIRISCITRKVLWPILLYFGQIVIHDGKETGTFGSRGKRER